MSNTSGEEEVCARCGHARRVHVPATAKLAAALRRRHPRVTCGEPTTDGWPCPCRSRFHAT